MSHENLDFPFTLRNGKRWKLWVFRPHGKRATRSASHVRIIICLAVGVFGFLIPDDKLVKGQASQTGELERFFICSAYSGEGRGPQSSFFQDGRVRVG